MRDLEQFADFLIGPGGISDVLCPTSTDLAPISLTDRLNE